MSSSKSSAADDLSRWAVLPADEDNSLKCWNSIPLFGNESWMKKHNTLDFYFEWGLYPLRDEERDALERREIKDLGLSEELVQRIHDLAVWYDSQLNPIYQMLPCLWQQQVCDAFNREANAVFEAVVAALPHVRINRCFSDIKEDPELYEYLLHPVQFYKRKGISGYDQL